MSSPTLNIVPLRVTGITKTRRNLIEFSRKIQQDLVEISGSAENALVDLNNINTWTGVKIDCFFNFLKTHPGIPSFPPSDSTNTIIFKELEITSRSFKSPKFEPPIRKNTTSPLTAKFLSFWKVLLKWRGRIWPLLCIFNLWKQFHSLRRRQESAAPAPSAPTADINNIAAIRASFPLI
jgi:hypothetical protein